MAPDAAHSDFKVRSRFTLHPLPPPPRILLRFTLESHALPPTSLRIQSDFLPLGPARGFPPPVSLSLLLPPNRDTSNITRADPLHPCTSDLGKPPVLSFRATPGKRSGSSIASLLSTTRWASFSLVFSSLLSPVLHLRSLSSADFPTFQIKNSWVHPALISGTFVLLI